MSIAGKTISIAGFIFCKPAATWQKDGEGPVQNGMHFEFATYGDWSDGGYAKVMPHTLTFVVPADFNPVPQQVAALQAALAEHDAASFTKRNAILEQLSRLQAISYDAEVA